MRLYREAAARRSEVTEVRSGARQDGEVTVLRHRVFEDFYRAQRDPLFRALALTIGNPHLAAEATDEAMARAYQHWRSVRSYANPGGWTYRVALNWARSWFRRTRREVYGLSPEQAAWDAEVMDPAVARALASLAVPARSVVVLRFYLDWSHAQIAQALGIPEGTVKSRLHRALAGLKRQLEEHS